MPNYRRAAVAGGSYFFTLVSLHRRPILTEPDIRAALREAITQVRLIQPFRIDGWVLLPDHMHAIWTLPDGDADFANRWRLIKGQVTQVCGLGYLEPSLLTTRRKAKGCGTLRQHRYWEHLIRDDRDFQRHLDYLHWNPVKHGLVPCVSAWPWSSFHRYVAQGDYPADWGGTGIGDVGIAGE